MIYETNANRWLNRIVNEVVSEYEDGADEGFIGCAWHTWRFGNTINACNKEIDKHCGRGKGTVECARFLSDKGATSFTDALFRCLKRRDPERFSKLVNSCSQASLDRLLKFRR